MRVVREHTECRTPQACNICRRRKTKCSGVKPQCRSCLKHKLVCSWPKSLAPGHFYAVDPSKPSISPGTATEVPPWTTIDNRAANNGSLVLPQKPLLQRLLKIFLSRHHDVELCSFLHKPSLDVSILSVKSPLLMTSIATLSALYLSDEEAKSDFGFDTGAGLSEHYAQFARVMARSLSDEPSVYTIQAHLILSLRELFAWTNFKAWMYTGTAIRMAHALQLGSEFNQRHSPRQKEIRRRTFWACFVMDRLISYSNNRPLSVDMVSVRIQLPCPENRFAFEEDYSGPSLDNITLHVNQLSQLGIVPFYIMMVKLWGDMAIVHLTGGRRRSKFAPNDPAGEFYKCDKAIEDFVSGLPPNLSWSARNYKLHQATGQAQAFVIMNFLLHHSRCVMHQEYLPQLDLQYALTVEIDPAATYDSAGISLDHIDQRIIAACVDSVNAITDMATILNSGDEQDREMLQSTFAANALMTASAVHLWILYTQTCDRCPKHVAKAKANQLLQIIKSWQTQWRVATAWVETLEILYKLYEFSYGTGDMSDLNCWETGEDEISESQALAEEVTDEFGGHPGLSDGDGFPDPSTICLRLFDKVRSISLNPLQATNVKKRTLRIYCRTLWQHMWSYEPLQGIGDEFIPLGGQPGNMATTDSVFENTLL